jgi:hypothetical protein
MATVTGNLADFGFTFLAGLHPEIIFTPSGPAILGATLLATRPIVATTRESDGAFALTLSPTVGLRPESWYTISFRWLDPAGNYVSRDFPDWKLYVPYEGGQVGDLLETPWNPSLVFVGREEPTDDPIAGMAWMNTDAPNTFSIWRD